MCHDDQNDDLAQTVSDLMSQEQEKEITKVSTLQGQSIGLLVLLLERGLLEPEDAARWEQLSEQAAECIKKILANGDRVKNDDFTDEEDMLGTRLDFIDANIDLGVMMRQSAEYLNELQSQREACVERLQELQGEPETD